VVTTWIDIVDTAVKIGLGAAISGVATYRVAILSHRNSVTKDIINKKIEIIEEISELSEEYFHFCNTLNNIVIGMLTHASNVGQALTENQKKRISEAHKNIIGALSKRNKALSKVQILRIPNAELALLTYNNILIELRDIIVYNNILISPEKHSELIDKFREQKDIFYKAISGYMASLGK
jgi:hypothetical protein